MHDDIKPAWLAMSPARLERHLEARQYPAAVIRDLVLQVKAVKEQRRRQRLKRTVAQQLWDDILKAARNELAGVRTMLSQARAKNGGNTPSGPKFAALKAYEDVLVDTIAKLSRIQKEGAFTPAQFVAHLREQTGRLIPNDGAHWTDYVGEKAKARVRDLFNQVPDPARGKRKTPFERRISVQENVIARAYLNDQITKAKEELEQLFAVTTDADQLKELRAKERDIHRAVHNLDKIKPTQPLPARWTALL